MPEKCEMALKVCVCDDNDSVHLLFSHGLFFLSPFQIQVIEDDKANKGTEPFTTGVRGQAPPLVTTNFQVKDQGEATSCLQPSRSHRFLA